MIPNENVADWSFLSRLQSGTHAENDRGQGLNTTSDPDVPMADLTPAEVILLANLTHHVQ